MLAYAALAFATAVLTRMADQRLFGPLPPAQRPPPAGPTTALGWARFALCYTAAAAAGLWLGQVLSPDRVIWVAATTLVVMQADARSNYRRIVERIVGTFLGVGAAWVAIAALHTPAALIVTIVAVTVLVPRHTPTPYWLLSGLIAALVLLLYDLGDQGRLFDPRLFAERLQDVLLGSVLALIGTALAFPHRVGDRDLRSESEELGAPVEER
jgi:uncharacterized membrane protein YccC